jgi:hypothetical protein
MGSSQNWGSGSAIEDIVVFTVVRLWFDAKESIAVTLDAVEEDVVSVSWQTWFALYQLWLSRLLAPFAPAAVAGRELFCGASSIVTSSV